MFDTQSLAVRFQHARFILLSSVNPAVGSLLWEVPLAGLKGREVSGTGPAMASAGSFQTKHLSLVVFEYSTSASIRSGVEYDPPEYDPRGVVFDPRDGMPRAAGQHGG